MQLIRYRWRMKKRLMMTGNSNGVDEKERRVKKGNKDERSSKPYRFLVSVNVVGSAGALRFLVNLDDAVSSVIEGALKSYAREGRLPSLGSDPSNFLLYSAAAPSEALGPREKIGTCGGGSRKFVLCRKQQVTSRVSQGEWVKERSGISSKGWSWKAWAWLNKSFNFRTLLSH